MEVVLQKHAVIFSFSGSVFKFLVERQEIDMVKMAGNLTDGDLV